MADRVVRAVLTGQSAGQVRAFEEAATSAEGSAARISKAVNEHGNKVSSSFKTMAAAAGSFGALEIGKEVVGDFNALNNATASLSQAMQDAGEKVTPRFREELEKTEDVGKKLGFTAADTAASIAQLRTAGVDTTRAMGSQAAIMDLARAKHISLADATTAVVQGMQGQGRALKQLNVELPAHLATTAQLDAANKSLAAAAQAVAVADQKQADAMAKSGKAYDTYNAAANKYGENSKQATAAQQKYEAALKVTQAAVVNAQQAHDRLAAAQKKVGDAQSDLGDRTKNLTGIVDILHQKVGGQAVAASETLSGRLEVLKTQAEGAAVKGIGAMLPVLEHLVPVIGFLGDHLNVVGPILLALTAAFIAHKVAVKASEVAHGVHTIALAASAVGHGIATAAVWAFNAAMTVGSAVTSAATAAVGVFNAVMDANPIVLVALAITGLVALLVGLEMKFHFVEVGVRALSGAFGAVVGWVKENWPIVAAVLTGGLSVAITWVATHIGQIKDAIAGVINDIVGFFRDLPLRVVNALSDFGGMLGRFFSGLPGEIGSGLQALGGFLISGFKTAINTVIINPINAALRWIGDLGGGIGPFQVHVRDAFGGSMPQIPTLDVGGEVLQTGWAIVHRGEVFSGTHGEVPLGGGGAPIYYEDNRHFTVITAADPQAVVNALRAYMQQNGSVPITVRAATRVAPA